MKKYLLLVLTVLMGLSPLVYSRGGGGGHGGGGHMGGGHMGGGHRMSHGGGGHRMSHGGGGRSRSHASRGRSSRGGRSHANRGRGGRRGTHAHGNRGGRGMHGRGRGRGRGGRGFRGRGRFGRGNRFFNGANLLWIGGLWAPWWWFYSTYPWGLYGDDGYALEGTEEPTVFVQEPSDEESALTRCYNECYDNSERSTDTCLYYCKHESGSGDEE